MKSDFRKAVFQSLLYFTCDENKHLRLCFTGVLNVANLFLCRIALKQSFNIDIKRTKLKFFPKTVELLFPFVEILSVFLDDEILYFTFGLGKSSFAITARILYRPSHNPEII
jgi:hypothetical protein